MWKCKKENNSKFVEKNAKHENWPREVASSKKGNHYQSSFFRLTFHLIKDVATMEARTMREKELKMGTI